MLFAPPLLEETNIRIWLGLEGDRPVGAAVTSIAHGINQVMLIVTLPGVRGRGYGAALTWEASLAEPSLPAMLLSSDLGRPVYERMGYLPLVRFTVWYRLSDLAASTCNNSRITCGCENASYRLNRRVAAAWLEALPANVGWRSFREAVVVRRRGTSQVRHP